MCINLDLGNIVDILIRAGANVNLTDDDFHSPLFLAMKTGKRWNNTRSKNIEIRWHLYSRIGFVSGKFILSWLGRREVAATLIEHGADVRKIDFGELTNIIFGCIARQGIVKAFNLNQNWIFLSRRNSKNSDIQRIWRISLNKPHLNKKKLN